MPQPAVAARRKTADPELTPAVANRKNRTGHRPIALLAALLLCAAATAQRVKVHGTVTDLQGSPIEIATVRAEGQLAGTATDLRGRYSFSVEGGDSVVIVFSTIGYQTRKHTLKNPKDSVTLNVALPPLDYELGEVTVSDRQKQMSTTKEIEINRQGVLTDAAGGTVESFIATQAGVSSHNEMSSQYNVRGGNFDENSVYVNGIEVYRPLLVRAGQQEGLSFINPDMVEKIAFSTGGFEPKYGDKMSSVLDITYKRPRHAEGAITASLLGGSLYAGYGNQKVSAATAVRYKTSRYLLGTLDTKGEYDPNFLDWQGYACWRPNEHWSLGVMGNLSRNSYQFVPTTRKTTFGTMEDAREFVVYFAGQEEDLFLTTFGAATLDFVPNGDNRISLAASAFHTKEEETYDITGQYWMKQSEGDDQQAVGTYMEHARNRLKANVAALNLSGSHQMGAHHLQWGAEYRREQINERQREWELRDSAGYSLPHSSSALDLVYSVRSHNKIGSNRLGAYLQDTYKFATPAGLWSITGGLRLAHWDWNRETLLSPRLSLGLIPRFNERFTFRLAGGVYYQAPFYKEFRYTDVDNGIGTVVLNKEIKSQRSVQVVLGGDYRFRVNDRPFIFTAEAYYKALSDLIPYSVNNVRIVYYGENSAKGHAAGLDLKLFGEFVPGTDSWLTLSVMSTRERLHGKSLPRPTDQSYCASLFFTDYFPGTTRWKLSLRACLADGLPFGPTHGEREEYIFRAPAYRRLDLGMSYRLVDNSQKRPRTQKTPHARIKNVWVGVDALNLLDINNVNSYYWITDVNNHQFAIPNYLTGRQINVRVSADL